MKEKKEANQPHHQQQSKGIGMLELLIFSAALTTGTASSILSKVMYAAPDSTGTRTFDKPLAQTLAMFIAMMAGLPMHWIILYFQIPFPGYDRYNPKPKQEKKPVAVEEDYDRTPKINSHKPFKQKHANEKQPLLPHHQPQPQQHHSHSATYASTNDYDSDDDMTEITSLSKDGTLANVIPFKAYFHLFIPAFFDCTSCALFLVGLLFLDVSIYQLLRGSGIIFVALLRQYGLKENLYNFQWVGLWWNVISALMVGATALLDAHGAETDDIDSASGDKSIQRALIGVGFMMAGTLFQSALFVLEEIYLVHDEVSVPPVLLVGMKGLWGAILTVVMLFPIGYYVPGHDNGSFEDPWITWEIIQTTPWIQFLLILYCFVIFGFNLFCILTTFLLSSVWHAILDNFRPLTVWMTDLLIFYGLKTATAYGEAWTKYSWLQLAGMMVLVYGTAVYDGSSILLKGEWYSFGFDFTEEYKSIQQEDELSLKYCPSLQSFLTASHVHDSIRYGKRVNTLEAVGSPRVVVIPPRSRRGHQTVPDDCTV